MARGKREKKPERKTGKRILKIILTLIIIAALAVGGYVAYMYLTYDRIEDNIETEIDNPLTVNTNIPLDKKLQITSWNIGFAAYLQDYSFFMDGGKESRARSENPCRPHHWCASGSEFGSLPCSGGRLRLNTYIQGGRKKDSERWILGSFIHFCTELQFFIYSVSVQLTSWCEQVWSCNTF